MIPTCSLRPSWQTESVRDDKTPEKQGVYRGAEETWPPHGARSRRIGYVRVSENDQTADLQYDALTDAGCDAIYGDLGVSGAQITRDELNKLFEVLMPGDTLVLWKLDRLSRSTLHLLEILDDLRQNGIDFIALTQGIDTTTAISRMLYGQLAVFAEFEREQIRERTKAGMAAAKARGKHLGRPRAIPDDVAILLRQRLEMGQASLETLAEELNLSKRTITRAIDGVAGH